MLERKTHNEKIFKGIAVSPGITIAPAFLYTRAKSEATARQVTKAEIETELQRFEDAVARSEKQLQKVSGVALEKIGDSSAHIFEAQALMLRDEMLYEAVVEKIKSIQCNADYAVKTVMKKHRDLLASSGNEYLRERVNDLLDVQDRILHNLQHKQLVSKIELDRIVVAETLTAADLVLFSRRQIRGCILDYGGATSHVSIMARSLNVPAVVTVGWYTENEIQSEQLLIIDGFSGKVIVNPNEKTLAKYQEKQRKYERLLEDQKSLAPLKAETLDHHIVHLRANVDVQKEIEIIKEFGAEGIGLMRTEMFYLIAGKPLGENEQFNFYKKAVDAVNPHPTTLRLIDLGGDKLLPLAHHEHNPYLGWRGVRILIDRPEVIKPQLKAALRASAFGKTRIMVPMVTTLDDVFIIKEILEEQKQKLRDKNIPFDEQIKLGIMVEVPSVAIMAKTFAKEVDFFSIGTNDLTQYTLAVDRGNDMVSARYDELHPAVLNLMKITVDAAQEAQIPVSICGELASNPRATPILVGLGVSELSMSPTFIPEVKRIIRLLTFKEAASMTHQALSFTNPNEVHKIVDEWLTEKKLEIAQLVIN